VPKILEPRGFFLVKMAEKLPPVSFYTFI